MSRLLRRAMSTIPPPAGASKATPAVTRPAGASRGRSPRPRPAPSPRAPEPIPDPARVNHLFPSASSVATTLPISVRRRREQFPPPKRASPSPLSDPAYHDVNSNKEFPPRLELDFRAIVRHAVFDSNSSEKELRALYMKAAQEWKSRVRGYAPPGGKNGRGGRGKHDFMLGVMGGQWKPDGKIGEGMAQQAVIRNEHSAAIGKAGASGTRQHIVGQRIYLPNIQIRLMRNHTPPGQAYDPMIATFRIPPGMTKTDLRSYLHAVYDLPVTFIRTDNYIGTMKRMPNGRIGRRGGSEHNYKRAVVGLMQPFHYPDDLEEMYAQGELNGTGTAEADNRLKFLEENFQIGAMEVARKRIMFKVFKGYRWRSGTHNNAAHTIKAIMAKRVTREEGAQRLVERARQGAMGKLMRSYLTPEEREAAEAVAREEEAREAREEKAKAKAKA
ncbi:hypothetical protein IAT38_005288 [Cryptococcus sp. DSM 104549]